MGSFNDGILYSSLLFFFFFQSVSNTISFMKVCAWMIVPKRTFQRCKKRNVSVVIKTVEPVMDLMQMTAYHAGILQTSATMARVFLPVHRLHTKTRLNVVVCL